jgi:hypothetical protein
MKPFARLFIIAIVLIIVGCSSNKVVEITLKDKFPKQLELVNKLVITSGSTGERKDIVDQSAIDEWIVQVKDITLYPQENQEERDGFLYAIVLYQDDIIQYEFSLNYIDKHYYKVSDEMLAITDQLFETQQHPILSN